MGRIGAAAVEAGREHCPNGYRLLSNFGHDGMQSQRHGHLHLIGGMYLGPYA
jgi:diadenosine tetraphosphate (Ap4A) HIT family hydrolase